MRGVRFDSTIDGSWIPSAFHRDWLKSFITSHLYCFYIDLRVLIFDMIGDLRYVKVVPFPNPLPTVLQEGDNEILFRLWHYRTATTKVSITVNLPSRSTGVNGVMSQYGADITENGEKG